jgi:hypothetical protein
MSSVFSRLANKFFGGNTTARKLIRRKPVRLGLEALEERAVPTTWTWTDADTIHNDNWSNTGNWSDLSNPMHHGTPISGDVAAFSSTYNKLCVVDINCSVDKGVDSGVDVEFGSGYTGTVKVDDNGSRGVVFSVSDMTWDNLAGGTGPTIQYTCDSGSSTGGSMVIYGIATIGSVTINYNGPDLGQTTVASGAGVAIGTSSGETISIEGQVVNRGTLSVGDHSQSDTYSSVKYVDSDSKIIDNYGTLRVYGCDTAAGTHIINNDNDGGYIQNENGGTVQLTGNSVNTMLQSLAIPIINYGNFTVDEMNWLIDEATSTYCLTNDDTGAHMKLGNVNNCTLTCWGNFGQGTHQDSGSGPTCEAINNSTLKAESVASSSLYFRCGTLTVDNSIYLILGSINTGKVYFGGITGDHEFDLDLGLNQGNISDESRILQYDTNTKLELGQSTAVAKMVANYYGSGSVTSGHQWLMINGANNWIYDDFNSDSLPSGTSEVSPASNPDSQWLISKN